MLGPCPSGLPISGLPYYKGMNTDVILLAEDDESHVELTLRSFRNGGLLNPVFVVSDGEEAIAYLAGEGKYADRATYPLPSLLLLDLKMPNKDGFDVLQWIRKQPALCRLRVVVLTSSGEIRDVNRAYELGANSFLVKPIRTDEFFRLTDAIKGYWLWLSAQPEIDDSPQTILERRKEVGAIASARLQAAEERSSGL
jgi:CheY-like chemotaxis protein